MRLLAIETASEACSVAVLCGDDTIERYRLAARGHAELILPWVGEVLAEAGVPLGELDAIAFSRGPGSFTSLRIGIGVVQGLAWGAGLPVVPVSSLQAAAQAAVGADVAAAVVAMDARMGQVYCGTFVADSGGVMQAAGEETVCDPGEVRRPLVEGFSAIGNGWDRYEALARLAAQFVSVHAEVGPRAASVADLARHWLQDNEALPAEMAQPVYLRDRVAEKPG
jgi:tRNA threonylcarbamoyladenosine biosynthesis protein TsaB